MARVVKIAKTLRNHWKKSTVAAVALTYGVNFGIGKYEAFNLMKAYCEEAKNYGDAPLPTGKKPRHITVLLNPAAKDGKGKNLFEKYAAPLFNLAGIRVSLVKTEHEGQAKSLMEVMENTDAVIVAGGDGTLSEAVTGLLRRPDGSSAAKVLPLGVVPIGKTNTLAKMMFWEDHTSDVRWIAEAAMAIIKEAMKPVDVMQIENEAGKTIYAVGKLNWGAFRDTESKISKYWYWGPLKSNIAFLFSSLKTWPPSYQMQLSFTPPCKGCSKCYEPAVDTSVVPARGRRWWHVFVRSNPSAYSVAASSEADYSKIVNEECGNWRGGSFAATEVSIATVNVLPNDKLENRDPTPFLEITIVPDNMSRKQFLSEGLRHAKEGRLNEEASSMYMAKEVQLVPLIPEGSEGWYSIDSEPFEVNPIRIKLLPKKIFVYCKE